VATGIAATLKARKQEHTRVLVIGGDGSTFDIGFGALSGMLERGDDVLYVCMDNGAYMNTGGQRSGATPLYAATSTHPVGPRSPGKTQVKKDLPAIVAAHGVPYLATASVAYLKDLQKKVKRAMTFHGPRYIQVDTPCPSVWGFPSDRTLELGRLGVQSGLIPIFEMVDGKITEVRKLKNRVPVEEYLKAQKRFRHLTNDAYREELKAMQAIVDSNIEKYGLV
jgi:pyruvate ferredoxin oxidoreductase beta subunit